MTIREVLATMQRRWGVVLVVVVVMGGLAVLFIQEGGRYTTRTIVAFEAPGDVRTGLDEAGSRQEGAIAFAASVVRIVNEGREPESYALGEAPIYGAGLREHVIVVLNNSGSQWTTSFGRAEIEVQAVGTTAEWVGARQQEKLARIEEVAEQQQLLLGIAREDRIVPVIEPVTTDIYRIVPGTAALLVGGAAMSAVTLLVAAWAAVRVDRAVRVPGSMGKGGTREAR